MNIIKYSGQYACKTSLARTPPELTPIHLANCPFPWNWLLLKGFNIREDKIKMIDEDISVCKLMNGYLPVKIKGVWFGSFEYSFVFERDNEKHVIL